MADGVTVTTTTTEEIQLEVDVMVMEETKGVEAAGKLSGKEMDVDVEVVKTVHELTRGPSVVYSYSSLVTTSSFHSHFSKFGGEVAVFVSDMVGFTSTTRRLGIIHYASLILKMRSLFCPILRRFNALHIFTEADNLWVVFPDVSSATLAALEGLRILEEYNATQSDPDFHIRLSGVGIHSGPEVWLDQKEGKFYGPVVDKAFRLGEDLCEDGEVLLSNYAWNQVKSDERFSAINAVADEDEGFVYHHLKGDYQHIIEGLQAVTPEEYPTATLLYQRTSADAETRARLDAEVREKYTSKATVVMFGAGFPELNARKGPEHMLRMKHEALGLMRPIVAERGGTMVEDGLWLFNDPQDAVKACLDIRKVVIQYNKPRVADLSIPLNGFGIHHGEILCLPGTNVHWGDPVNTASKLGEDLSENMDVMLSPTVFELVSQLDDFRDLSFEKRTLEASGADLTCYVIPLRSS